MLISSDEALDQVIRFDRTIGYPNPTKDRDSFERLLTSLIDACNKYGVAPDRLVTACLEASKHCPTDYDLLTFASGLRDVEPWHPPKSPKCVKCHGSGFEIVYALHTAEGHGEHSFVKKEIITEEQHELLKTKINWERQKLFSGAKRCTAGCSVPGARL